MATSNESAGLRRQSARRPKVAKPYRTPTLVKGPVLSAITSATTLLVVSGTATAQ
jgi:hypothetical protein